MTKPELNSRPHTLYRFFGAGGTLLYIGITADLPTRFHNHREDKPWWLGVSNVTVEHYPTREAVLEAERRAIIAERPLYNTQHNTERARPTERLKPHSSPAPSSPLSAVCMRCEQVIARGDKGVVHVRMEDVAPMLQEMRDRELDRLNHPWEPIDLATYLSRSEHLVPDEAPWLVHCDTCNPHECEDGTWCGGCYWFSVDRCRTWAQLIEWTCHLSEKDWLRATNWMDFIRHIAHGTAKTGLVASPLDTEGAATA